MPADTLMRTGRYAWAPGSRLTIDPDAAAAEFAAIEREQHGELPLAAIVERALESNSVLRGGLTADHVEAVRLRHLDEAAHMARSLRYLLVNPSTEDEVIGARAYQPLRAVTDDNSRPGVYIKVTQATVNAPPPATPPVRFTVGRATTPAPALPTAVADLVPVPTQPPAELPTTQRVEWRGDPPEPTVLTPSRDRARTFLLRWADTLAADNYFAGVVAAIRALP